MILNRGVGLLGVLFAMVVPSGAQAQPSPTVKCQAKKVDAQRICSSCRLKAEAKSIRSGTAANFAKCDQALAEQWAKAERKWGASCPTVGDVPSVQTRVIDFAAQMVGFVGIVRFVDNGDGTVTDLRTGLMWEKKTNLDFERDPADVHDADNVFTWIATGTQPDGKAFTNFLARLNNCSIVTTATRGGGVLLGGFAGHCDWRMPNIFEQIGIRDDDREDCEAGSIPCIDPAFGDTSGNLHWSSTTDAADENEAWVTFFSGSGSDGLGTQPKRLLQANVRAVRNVD